MGKIRKNLSSTALIMILFLLFSLMIGLSTIKPVAANPQDSLPILSMPKEYINYTIASINGTFWAKIDGYYPIYLEKDNTCSFKGDLPMVYPMPPQTTNISVTLANNQVAWSNYTQTNPSALHHTAIGDWWMIYCELENVSDYFALKIHYEHPLQTANGSFIFLYDLNISPYLTEQSNNSTAYFTIQMPTDTTNLKIYSTETDAKWNPVDFNLTKTNSTQIAYIQMYSEFGKPLLGDLVVEFSNENEVGEFPIGGIIVLLLIATLLSSYVVVKSRNKQS